VIPFVAYILSIVAANLTLLWVGLIPVGFGLLAPAGVLWAGLALTLRDLVQDRLGRSWTVAAILVGACISALFDPTLGLASGTAFLVSELADMAVYTPLRERRWLLAILLSNSVGLVVDSALFLWLAFGSLDFLMGQVWAKFAVTVVTVAALWVWRRRGVLPRHPQAELAG
jgi:queuosine precursor transporter